MIPFTKVQPPKPVSIKPLEPRQACVHEWSQLFDKMGDEHTPVGRRCEKCRKQESFPR